MFCLVSYIVVYVQVKTSDCVCGGIDMDVRVEMWIYLYSLMEEIDLECRIWTSDTRIRGGVCTCVADYSCYGVRHIHVENIDNSVCALG